MYYRILKAPPGYGPDRNFMVVAYETLELSSQLGRGKKYAGALFARTLEEARLHIPTPASQLPFEPDHQFVELWEIASSKTK